MNIGGGYIGACLAMGLPFLLVFMLRPHGVSLLAMFGIAISAGYVLIVTFARRLRRGTDLDSDRQSMLAWAARHRHTGTVSALALSAMLLLTIGGIAIAAVSNGFMTQRLRTKALDIVDREGNWTKWSGSARRQA